MKLKDLKDSSPKENNICKESRKVKVKINPRIDQHQHLSHCIAVKERTEEKETFTQSIVSSTSEKVEERERDFVPVTTIQVSFRSGGVEFVHRSVSDFQMKSDLLCQKL